MKKSKIVLLFILGGLATVAILFPLAIIWGLFLGVVPGIILALAPTAFTYYALALLLGTVLKFCKIPFPTTVSLALLITIGCYASYTLNIPIIDKIKEYESKDVILEEKFKIPNTIAIYSKQYIRHKDACNTLCQGLLYNKAAQKVLVVTDPSVVQGSSNQSVTAYEIQQGNNCTNAYVISKRWGKIASANVESRIAAGECLVKTQTKISEADVIFFNDNINLNDGYQKYGSLKRRVVFIDYIELLKNVDGRFNTIYRYSEISAQPFAYPLSFGHILGAGGGSMSLNFGFFHTTKTVNNPGPSYGNPIQEFKPQMEVIFGDALKPIEPAKIDTRKLAEEALSSEKPENTAGLAMIENHMAKLFRDKLTPTDEDMQMVIDALKDKRANNWFYLSRFVFLWSDKRGELPDGFIQELANRALTGQNASEAGRAIRFLPDGQAEIIYPKIKQIALDEQLREDAYGAVIRLSDGGDKAIPIYIDILNEYTAALNNSNRNDHKNKLRQMRNSPTAAMIGLCRLGFDALPAKNILFNLVNEERPQWTITKLAMDALWVALIGKECTIYAAPV
jgi:hypothetical protein